MLSSYTLQCTMLQLVYSTLKYEFLVGMSVYVLACVIPPTANLPTTILTPRFASRQKTAYCRDRRFYLTQKVSTSI